MTTMLAKKEDLPRLIDEEKGWINAFTNLVKWQPHEDANQALQLLSELDYKILPSAVFGFIGHMGYRFPHNNTPESICVAICLAWLASHGINVELED